MKNLNSKKKKTKTKLEFIRVFKYKDILMVNGICPLLVTSKPLADFFFKQKPRVA